jgi:crossover junction endodeoxyribonuclease RuvC
MARMSVRQMWKAKLEGRLPSPVRQVVSDGLRRPFAGRVLGIDPSLRA